jgi:hypothetical protein
LQSAMDNEFFYQEGEKLRAGFEKARIPCQKLF